jgi:cardiolipin synthase A/B
MEGDVARRVRAWRWDGHSYLAVCLLAVLLAGCGELGATSGCVTITISGPPSSASRLVCVQAACAAQHVQVFAEPDAGEAPVLQAIRAASRSVWVEVYLLTDRNVVHALEDAAARGLDVRVLLEPHPFGGGVVSVQVTLDELNAAGAQARASDPAYHYTHAKFIVIDAATAYILTSNLTKSGLGGSSVTANRDYGVVDMNPGDVAEVTAIFQAD